MDKEIDIITFFTKVIENNSMISLILIVMSMCSGQVILRFSYNKEKAGDFMDGHNQWIKRGFEEGVFLLAGSLQPNLGGSIIAHNLSLSELQTRVGEAPFVEKNIVTAEILEISPKKTDERLHFLWN